MSLSGWFAKHRASLAAKNDHDNAFYLRHFADQESRRDKQHNGDPAAKHAGATRPAELEPRSDHRLVKTHNDGGKRSS